MDVRRLSISVIQDGLTRMTVYGQNNSAGEHPNALAICATPNVHALKGTFFDKNQKEGFTPCRCLLRTCLDCPSLAISSEDRRVKIQLVHDDTTSGTLLNFKLSDRFMH